MRRERTEEECLRRVSQACAARPRRRWALLAAALAAGGVAMYGISRYLWWAPIAIGVEILCLVFPVFVAPYWRDRSLADRVRVIRDPQALESIAMLIDIDTGKRTQQAAIAKIAELLPQAQPAALRLDDRTVQFLISAYHSAPPSHRATYIGAVLEYAAAIGHAPALAATAWLDEHEADPVIREAAICCRDRLLDVQADAERSGTLLRPAEAPGETLLRPAEPAPEEQLLRAVDGEAE